jgi:hypothetical protein
VLFLVGDDPLVHVRQITPIDQVDQLPAVEIASVYVPLMNSGSWRHDLATKALSTWAHGGDVVVTKRVWSQKPKREWNWAEGDDPEIHWSDMVRFFAPLEHESIGTGEDAFAVIAHSPKNETLLKSFALDNSAKPRSKEARK